MAGGNIKGITIQLDGDTSNLNKALKKVDGETKSVQKELKQVESLLKFDPSNVELLAQKQQLLGGAVEGATRKLDALKQAQREVERQFASGEIGEEAFRKFQREIIATEGQLKAFKSQAESTKVKINVTVDAYGINRLKGAMGELGAEAKRVGKEIGTALSDGAKVGAAGVGALVIGSSDLNSDLARLRTNAALSGQDMGVLEDALGKIVTVTGEADSGVETLSNIMASGFKDNQLEQVVDGINGAAIRFSDTLKTEGIADGIQETFATGKAIGMFAELLERSGVDLDTFNDKLAIAKEEGTETDLVLQTMADLGLNDVTEKFKELNPELEEANEATFQMQKSFADLAIALTPLVTMVTDVITKIVDWAKENEGLAKGFAIASAAIVAVSTIIKILTPIVKTAITIFKNINNVMKAVRLVFIALTGPVGIVIAIVGALITIGIALYRNWDTVSKNVVKAFTFIKNGITKAKQAIAKEVSLLIKDVINAFKKAFTNKTLSGAGKDLVLGLAKGISDSIGRVKEAAKKLAGSVTDKVKSLLKIKSPSRVMMELGMWAGVGLANGIEGTKKDVEKASENVSKVIVSATKKNNASVIELEKAANKEKTKIQTKYAADFAKLKKKDNAKRIELEKKMANELKTVTDKLAKDVKDTQNKLQQEQMDAVVSYIDKKKKANELSLVEESAYWRKAYSQFKTGSDQRIALEEKYQESVKTINEAITKSNEDYLAKAKKIDEDLVANIESANKDYQSAYDSRYNTVKGYYGLLAEVQDDEEASTEQMFKNLRDQGYALKEWQNLLAGLKNRGIGDALYSELEDLGPNALSNLRALTNLTDDELNHYVALFEDKMATIKKITDKDLAPLKDITEKNIIAMEGAATVELANLNQEWQKSIVNLVGATEKQLTTLNQVGKNAAQSLLDGLTSMQSTLVNQARAMAEAISKTINQSLNLSDISGLSTSSINLNKSASNAGSLLNSSSATSKQQQVSGQIVLQQQQQDNTALVNAVLQLANNQPDVKLVVDGRELASIVSRNQYNTASLDGLVKGVTLG